MEFLKQHLGDELYAQVAEKLKDSSVKLADLSGGAYVGKEKHDALQQQLTLAQDALKSFDGKTVEQINAEVAEWKQKAVDLETKATADLTALKYAHAVDIYAGSLKFSSKAAEKAFVADLKAAGLKLSDDGKLLGADDFVKSARETDPAAFATDNAGKPLPKFVGGGEHSSPPPAKDWKGMSLTERAKLFREDRAKAAALAKQAGETLAE